MNRKLSPMPPHGLHTPEAEAVRAQHAERLAQPPEGRAQIDARANARTRLARTLYDARRVNPDAQRLAVSSLERLLAGRPTPEFLDPIVACVLAQVAEDPELLAVVQSLAQVYTLEIDPAEVLG